MTNRYHLITFLIVFIILCAFISTVLIKDGLHKKEGFVANDAPLQLKILQVSGRSISFPTFGKNPTRTASQRAWLDESLKTVPEGKCAIIDTKSDYNTSMSTVNEDWMTYSLRKACLGLRVANYRFDYNGTRLLVDFDISTPIYLANFTKFMLVNPLFVEFTFGRNASIAYIPSINQKSNSLVLSSASYKTMRTVQIAFDIAVRQGAQRHCDQAFNYAKFSKFQTAVNNNHMISIISSDKVLNLTVFYLGNGVGPDFQQVGRTLPVANAVGKSSLTLFDTSYTKLPTDSSAYNFMNNFALFYNNYMTPVLTFSFDIVVGSDKKTRLIKGDPSQLLKAKMDQNKKYGGAPCANNILSMVMTGYARRFRLQVGIGNHKDCGTVKGTGDLGNPALYMDLPYLTPNTTISLTLTIGHNQKHLYAEWYDINAGNKGKQFIYAKTAQNVAMPPYNVCNAINSTKDLNNFTRMFSSLKGKARPQLSNTTLQWDPIYVTKIKGVSLGYANFQDIHASQ